MFTVEQVRRRAADARELVRARSVLRSGQLAVLRRDGARLIAQIQAADHTYNLELGADLAASCTCVAFARSGARRFCKHAGAAALYWLESEGQGVQDRALDDPVARALGRLKKAELRALLLEAAGRSRQLRLRIVVGRWPA